MKGTTNPLPRCYDCNKIYGSTGWCEVIIPTDVWVLISPTRSQGGLLCFNCIAIRLRIWDLKNVPFRVASGPFETTDEGDCEVCSRAAFHSRRCLDHFETPEAVGLGVYGDALDALEDIPEADQ